MKAILLAGGKGTRLRPLTIHTPKPIVPIFDRPFLHYQLDLLKQVPEIDEVILSLNYQPRRIEEIFGDGGDSGLGDPLRRRAGAARHRRRGALRRRIAARIGGRVQRRRADAGRPRGGHRAAPRAQGQGDDRADAGRQPERLRAGRDRRRRQHPAVPREAERRRDHLRHDQRRHLHPRARHLRPDSEGHALVDRAELLSVADRARRNLRRLRLSRLLDRHRHAGEVHAGAPRHHGRRIGYRGRRRLPPRPTPPGCRRTRASKRAPIVEGPCFIDEGVGRQGRRPDRSLQRHRPPVPHRGARGRSSTRSSGRTRASARKPSCAARSSAATATSAAARIVEDGVVLGDKSVVTDYSRLYT